MKVLVIAPHPDDEILGAGGTIINRVKHGDEVYVCIVTKGKALMFDPELIKRGRQEALEAHKLLGVSDTCFLDFPAAEMDGVALAQIIRSMEDMIQKIKPEEVYIPHRGDIHNDHKVVADAAMVALRPKYRHKVKRVYAYETPSETGWDLPLGGNVFVPTVYEDISKSLLEKLEALAVYQSQAEVWPGARSPQAVEALARYRGSTVCIPAAESFYLVREIR